MLPFWSRPVKEDFRKAVGNFCDVRVCLYIPTGAASIGFGTFVGKVPGSLLCGVLPSPLFELGNAAATVDGEDENGSTVC
jgi:hypothetical protein